MNKCVVRIDTTDDLEELDVSAAEEQQPDGNETKLEENNFHETPTNWSDHENPAILDEQASSPFEIYDPRKWGILDNNS